MSIYVNHVLDSETSVRNFVLLLLEPSKPIESIGNWGAEKEKSAQWISETRGKFIVTLGSMNHSESDGTMVELLK